MGLLLSIDAILGAILSRVAIGVDTTDDTLITWDASNHFWSYCFIYEGFDYVKIQHEGHTEYGSSSDSSVNMSNSNGEGTYQVSHGLL